MEVDIRPAPRSRVLVVDDEPDLLELVSFFVGHFFPDVVVCSAASPEAALRLLAPDLDVIVADYRMPGMDGIEFLRASASSCPRARRVLMTAYADSSLERLARQEAGVHGFLRKPFAPAQLQGLLSPLLAA